MKTKIIIAAVLCLIVAQVLYTLSRDKSGTAPEPSAPNQAQAESQTPGATVPKTGKTDTGVDVPQDAAPGEPPSLPAPAPAFHPDEVSAVSLSSADGATIVDLRKTDRGWIIGNLQSAPASLGKIMRFLGVVLSEHRKGTAVPGDPATVGLDDAGAVLVKLTADDGRIAGLRVGYSFPDGSGATCASEGNGSAAFVVPGDARGEMGLWDNQPGQHPNPKFWLEKRVLRVDPEKTTALTAWYPDHRIAFARNAEGKWEFHGTAPGGEWSADGFAAWLSALADFQISDLAAADEAGTGAPSHRLEIIQDDIIKTIRAIPNRGGEGMWVETSDYPGRFYFLPNWRFNLYFQRLESLFPAAVPSYEVDDILTVDIRRAGESIKLINRDGAWRSVLVTHPLKIERIAALARHLAAWRPEDYADPGDSTARPAYGGPQVEVVLAGGDVFQYRLGGFHPVFPWRYVSVNGAVNLATGLAEAKRLFPDFSEILDLGPVFPGLDSGQLAAMEFYPFKHVGGILNPGDHVVALRLGEDGSWLAEMEGVTSPLSKRETVDIIEAPLAWQVAGVYEETTRAAYPLPLCRIHFFRRSGQEVKITPLATPGRNIPYEDGDRVYLIERSDFSNWLMAIQKLAERIASENTPPEKDEPSPIPEDEVEKKEQDREPEITQPEGENEPPTTSTGDDLTPETVADSPTAASETMEEDAENGEDTGESAAMGEEEDTTDVEPEDAVTPSEESIPEDAEAMEPAATEPVSEEEQAPEAVDSDSPSSEPDTVADNDAEEMDEILLD